MDTKISSDAVKVDNVELPKGGALTAQTIQHSRGWSSLGLGEIWEFRELAYFMVVREIQGVYRQTALGISWIFIRPIINMVLLSTIFGAIVHVPSDQFPYPLFSLAALIPWTYFSNSVMRASRSLVDNLQIISKVYFPRLILPLAASISGLTDLLAAFLIFIIALLIYRLPLRLEMAWLPGLILITLLFGLAVGLWSATLSVRYRDVAFAINFLLLALMYASPVIYPVSMVPQKLQFIYQLNPMTGIISGFRWALLGGGDPPGMMFFISCIIIIFGLVSGMYIFRRTEREISDIL
jgi:homopolymeric O-antigen transport system permease protein